MRRISVVGTSGSGKTTTARALAKALGAPCLELDAVHWLENWTPTDPEEMRADVAAFLEQDSWVVDGNYRGVLGFQVWWAADTVVWVDPSRARVMWQLTARTVRRVVTRKPLWNGNREPLSNVLRIWSDDSILRWAWATFETNRARNLRAMSDPKFAHLTFIRLRTRKQIAEFLRESAENN